MTEQIPPQGIDKEPFDLATASEVAKSMLEAGSDPGLYPQFSSKPSGESVPRTLPFEQQESQLDARNEQLEGENESLRKSVEHNHYMATHDELTGLLNRRGLQEFLDGLDHTEVALLYCDVTRLKAVNDKLDHARGDKALIGTTDALQEALREGDQVARVGGDEFIVVLTEARDTKDPKSQPQLSLIQRIGAAQMRVSSSLQHFLEANDDITEQGFDLAVGYAVWQPGKTIEEIMGVAEKDMYTVKSKQHKVKARYR